MNESGMHLLWWGMLRHNSGMTFSVPRPLLHVTPPQGRLNDPNGVVLVDGVLHVFYQYDPSYPHTPKRTSWAHVSAPVAGASRWQFTHHPTAFVPDRDYDSHGCYSGGAAVDSDGSIRLFYTGNVKAEGQRLATQNVVYAEDLSSPQGGVFRKSIHNPVIPAAAEGFSGDFRDPVITPTGDAATPWRLIVGARDLNNQPAVAVFHGTDLEQWEFAGRLTFDTEHLVTSDCPDSVPGGYMWECPNLIRLVDQDTGVDYDVLVICPQGVDPVQVDGRWHYQNSDQCGYLVGHLNGTTFQVIHGFQELDLGHSFYAPQLIPDTRDTKDVAADPAVLRGHEAALLVGWMGLPGHDDSTIFTRDGWLHALTVIHRLTLASGVLVHEFLLPDAEKVETLDIPTAGGGVLQAQQHTFGPHTMLLTIPGEASDSSANTDVTLRLAGGAATVMRKGSRLTLEHAGETRSLTLADPSQPLTILIDSVAVEILADGGRRAMSVLCRNADPFDAAAVLAVDP